MLSATKGLTNRCLCNWHAQMSTQLAEVRAQNEALRAHVRILIADQGHAAALMRELQAENNAFRLRLGLQPSTRGKDAAVALSTIARRR